MNLAQASVRRPVFATMMTLIVVVLGATALGRLHRPAAQRRAADAHRAHRVRGRRPEVMERLVTQIVEEIVATVPGVSR
jgi:hydrophobic/amphiphilic exporter-1 (mainly G- bacteria), HAE1 family